MCFIYHNGTVLSNPVEGEDFVTSQQSLSQMSYRTTSPTNLTFPGSYVSSVNISLRARPFRYVVFNKAN